MSSNATLVDTQPLEDELSSMTSSPPTSSTWGWLVTLRQRASHLSLPVPVLHPITGELVKVGRDPSCYLVVDEVIFMGSTDEDLQSAKISRVQFQLSRVGAGVALLDKSMNGTYVNGLKVGKEKQHSLDHGDIISLLQHDFEVYQYVDESRMRMKYPLGVTKKYIVGRILGQGSSAIVREGFERDSHKQVAMKFIGKEKWPSKYSEPEDLSREVDILLELTHPCITKVLDVVDDKDFVIIMEYAAGGELFDQVIKEYETNKLEEVVAKLRFYQICHTIAYLHEKNVCHRDLKLENILLMEKSPNSLVKITDFGLSKHFNSVDVLATFVGTPVYMAPEVISLSSSKEVHEYTCKSDCWSLGVVLYMLLSGHQPFRDTSISNQMLQEKIVAGKYEPMTGPRWDGVSDDAKDMVVKLLVVDPSLRLGAEDVLSHKWFVMDREVVRQAEEVMGLMGSEADSGRGSMVVKDGGDGKRKRNVGDDDRKDRARVGKKRGPTEEVRFEKAS